MSEKHRRTMLLKKNNEEVKKVNGIFKKLSKTLEPDEFVVIKNELSGCSSVKDVKIALKEFNFT